MSTLERAIEIAARAHAGQRDKGGLPYILHPLRVMMSVRGADADTARIVAVLHDVIEDTPVTAGDLRREGFSDAIVDAVVALTRRDDETYEAFVERAGRNPIARTVKLADIADNMDLTRLKDPTERDLARMERYKRALVQLNRCE